ncbi:hypothetical protein PLICRDRAFT_170224 [Plicaturopsis crispa FD-325 SS-3]|nr:hypothetical protein PLICRDRAFT_170224 [Plicaturopsis crispa FD-325 SS-3]
MYQDPEAVSPSDDPSLRLQDTKLPLFSLTKGLRPSIRYPALLAVNSARWAATNGGLHAQKTVLHQTDWATLAKDRFKKSTMAAPSALSHDKAKHPYQCFPPPKKIHRSSTFRGTRHDSHGLLLMPGLRAPTPTPTPRPLAQKLSHALVMARFASISGGPAPASSETVPATDPLLFINSTTHPFGDPAETQPSPVMRSYDSRTVHRCDVTSSGASSRNTKGSRCVTSPY